MTINDDQKVYRTQRNDVRIFKSFQKDKKNKKIVVADSKKMYSGT